MSLESFRERQREDARKRAIKQKQFRNGTADTVPCDVCHQERNADHVIQARVGVDCETAERCFICGSCLDKLAECLYRHCAKKDIPTWRRARSQSSQ